LGSASSDQGEVATDANTVAPAYDESVRRVVNIGGGSKNIGPL
jgi:hypothetical protein